MKRDRKLIVFTALILSWKFLFPVVDRCESVKSRVSSLAPVPNACSVCGNKTPCVLSYHLVPEESGTGLNMSSTSRCPEFTPLSC